MKVEDIGIKVTVLEGLAYLVPGTVFVWILVQFEAQLVRFLPDSWPVTPLDTAMAAALIILSGVALQEAGHIFKWPYDHLYKRWRRRKGDALKDRFDKAVKPLEAGTGHAFHFAKLHLVNAGRPLERVLLLEGISKMFRAMALGCLVLAVCFGVLFDGVSAGLAVLAMVIAFMIHARFRFASTEVLYLSFCQWQDELKSAGASVSD